MKKIIIIFVLLLSLSGIQGCGYKECNENLNCFKDSIKICEKAVVLINKEGASVTGRVRGLVPGDLCFVSFKVNDIKGWIAEEYPAEAKLAIDNTLNCEIDYKKLENYEDLSLLTENYDRCSGPLKAIIDSHIREELNLIREFNELLI
jgi:hypothetical protein